MKDVKRLSIPFTGTFLVFDNVHCLAELVSFLFIGVLPVLYSVLCPFIYVTHFNYLISK